MKKILFLLTFVLVIGCTSKNESISVEKTGKNNAITISFLFEKDGLKMYRFYDAGHFHYFTTKGDVMSTQTVGKVYYKETIESK